jgi:iron complex outermembrane receptor protein
MLYTSIETGYRSGGFSPATGYETFSPEEITAYTVGSKNRFFDNQLELNVEAFYWEYKDQQVSHVAIDDNGDAANITENIGKSTIQGIEIQTSYLLTPTTLLRADVQ